MRPGQGQCGPKAAASLLRHVRSVGSAKVSKQGSTSPESQGFASSYSSFLMLIWRVMKIYSWIEDGLAANGSLKCNGGWCDVFLADNGARFVILYKKTVSQLCPPYLTPLKTMLLVAMLLPCVRWSSLPASPRWSGAATNWVRRVWRRCLPGGPSWTRSYPVAGGRAARSPRC
mgnify:CR=1 FL=1